MKKIVCFGGGNALPKAVLAGLKKYPVKIISVTSMTESGGSTGQLRKDLNVLPPGDISRHLITLSDGPRWKKDLFYFRFGKEKFPGGHIGHRFGTVFIAGLEYFLKDFRKALQIAHQFLEVKKHQVLPATIKKTNLWAILENGKEIIGEDEIDVPKVHDGNLKIKKVLLKPKTRAFPPVLKAIKKADLILIGPGDLYSSLIPCFLPEGMKAALQRTKAKKVFICPSMTKFGETNNFSVLNFTNEIEKYLGRPLDYVIYNNYIPPKERVKKYKREEKNLLELVQIDPELQPPLEYGASKNLDKKKFIGKNLLIKSGQIIYDPNKLAKILLKL